MGVGDTVPDGATGGSCNLTGSTWESARHMAGAQPGSYRHWQREHVLEMFTYFQSQCELNLLCPPGWQRAPTLISTEPRGLQRPHPSFLHPADQAYFWATAFLTISSVAGVKPVHSGMGTPLALLWMHLHPDKMTSPWPRN